MTTKGRYQTVKNKSTHPPTRYSVVDTTMDTLGARFVCATDTEKKADYVAYALNFSDKPSDYGYKLVY